MKILSAEQIREIDAKTVTYEAVSSLELMKRAAKAFYYWFIEKYQDKQASILILSGTGNNGGDGIVVARLLSSSGYSVKVCNVEYSKERSEDCAHNIRRAKAENVPLLFVSKAEEIPDFSDYAILIDALFGTGLNRDVSGIAHDVILRMNESGKTIISIDVPSGLFMDKHTDFAVQAAHTVTFQIPKAALFLPDNAPFTGEVTLVDIGLSRKAICEAETNWFFQVKEDIAALLKPLSRFAHKGTQGHALIIGGSGGKTGSVCLAAKAALKTGCGLVTAYGPKGLSAVLGSWFPEAMVIEDADSDYLSDIAFDIRPDAIGVGIGLGTEPATQKAFYRFLSGNKQSLVVDADGLNILSQHKEWLSLLPVGTILTPHPKELSRLIGSWENDYDKMDKIHFFVKKYPVILILKGAYSMIVNNETVYINSSGTPALATAGSGDVLTGMVAGLLAQGYPAIDAARMAVYMHGRTADRTQSVIHPRSFVASDIIDQIGNVYFELDNELSIH